VVAAGGVEPGDPVLLVRGRSQWQVDGLIDQDVMRVDTVTRRPHPVDVGCHAPIDDDRAPLVHSDARVAGQIGRRSHTDGDQDDIAGNVQVSPRSGSKVVSTAGAISTTVSSRPRRVSASAISVPT
jgi:hypothetical protein